MKMTKGKLMITSPKNGTQYNKTGSRGRTRTYDQAVNSRPLYQLSYSGMVWLPSLDSNQG